MKQSAVAWLIGLGVATFLVWSAAPAPAQSQTLYGRASCTFSLRGSPGWKSKRVGGVLPGQAVTVLKKTGRWVRVKTSDGQTGWTHAGFLTPTRQLPQVARFWSDKFKAAAKKVQELTGRLSAAQNQLQVQKRLVAVTKVRLDKVATEFTQFKAANKHFTDIKAANDACQAERKKLTGDVKKCRTKAEGTTLTTNLRWFLAGALVLFVGWIMGMAMGRSRRRGRSTY
ncbi:MAG: TIGR04211 family SH3 domain-containing protein [Proteobacteria bacterium]|nr:TIGR04211 family SH3 domain-containing protein [Pseudomonadota bacterium]MBU1742988.1 TIGR04211 family SH3 domain-containing protein [Pseudomonadota bacterium]